MSFLPSIRPKSYKIDKMTRNDVLNEKIKTKLQTFKIKIATTQRGMPLTLNSVEFCV